MKRFGTSLLFLCMIALLTSCDTSSSSRTASPVTPTSCTNCRLFITAHLTNGAFGGAAAADALCAADANKPNTGTYKALLMDNTRNQSTNWVLKANQAYYQVDGTTLIGTTNSSRVFALSTGHLINPTASTGFDYLWTGIEITSDTVWTKSIYTCNNWTVGTAMDAGAAADSVSTDYVAMGAAQVACNDPSYTIYCVEQ